MEEHVENNRNDYAKRALLRVWVLSHLLKKVEPEKEPSIKITLPEFAKECHISEEICRWCLGDIGKNCNHKLFILLNLSSFEPFWIFIKMDIPEIVACTQALLQGNDCNNWNPKAQLFR